MKVDLKREIATYAARRGTFLLVTVPPLQMLMIDGHGDPNTSVAYRDALATIFPLAYRLKFLSKGELGRDYTVMPLEALWWSDDMDAFSSARDKTRWHVGSYDDEAPVLDAMHHEFIPAQSLRMTGKHHEIYLSDARRTPADKLRTILRQPVAPVSADRTEWPAWMATRTGS